MAAEAAAAPPGAPAAVVCTVSAALTLDKPVILDATEPIVVATSFLNWRPLAAAAGSAARVSLTQWEMYALSSESAQFHALLLLSLFTRHTLS